MTILLQNIHKNSQTRFNKNNNCDENRMKIKSFHQKNMHF